MRLVLIRHGETEWSATARHTGNTDLALTERGRQQAIAAQHVARNSIGDVPFVLWSSPLQRARTTAGLIFDPHMCEVDERLREFDYGDYEGITTVDIRKSVPGWTVWDGCPGGESLSDVVARVDSFLSDLVALSGDDEDDADTDSSGKHVQAIVAHGHLLRILAARVLGQPGDFGRHLSLDTASVSVLDHYRDGQIILQWNRTARV